MGCTRWNASKDCVFGRRAWWQANGIPPNLDDLKDKLTVQVDKTAENLGKEVNFNFQFDEVTVEEYAKSSLSESLLHILNNCVGHGIEMPDDREMLGKERAGQIEIVITEGKSGFLDIKVSDDGAGISFSSIVKNAVKKKIIDLDKVPDISKEELLNLVFEPGFSSKDEIRLYLIKCFEYSWIVFSTGIKEEYQEEGVEAEQTKARTKGEKMALEVKWEKVENAILPLGGAFLTQK